MSSGNKLKVVTDLAQELLEENKNLKADVVAMRASFREEVLDDNSIVESLSEQRSIWEQHYHTERDARLEAERVHSKEVATLNKKLYLARQELLQQP